MKRVLLGLIALCAPLPVLAQNVVITNARLVIGDGSPPIENGTVVIQNGRVVGANEYVPVPEGIRRIDAKGKWVTPGLFVAVTDLGLVDVGAAQASNDADQAKSPFSAALDVAPAINPAALPIAVSRAGGVTRAAVVPGGSGALFAGQGAVIDLGADRNPISKARAFQYVELGEAAGEQAGGSRVAAHTQLRNALAEARELAASPTGARRDDVLLSRADAVALGAVLRGEQLLLVRAERAHDIRMALALKQDFPAIKLVLVGATEGWLVAAEIATAGVPVLATPLNDLPAQFEQLAATQSNVGRMARAGVKVALGAFGDQPRYAPQYAGNMVALTRVPGASGLTWDQAMAAITSGPAAALGVADRFGSLLPGRAGDVVIWDGDPLEAASGVTAVFIDGVEQPLTNHQTRLRDRYRTPTESSLPKAFER